MMSPRGLAWTLGLGTILWVLILWADGAATFVMSASVSGTPPYETRAVTCDSSGNSWVN